MKGIETPEPRQHRHQLKSQIEIRKILSLITSNFRPFAAIALVTPRLGGNIGHGGLSAVVDDGVTGLHWSLRHDQLGFLWQVKSMDHPLLARTSWLGTLLEQVHGPSAGLYTM